MEEIKLNFKAGERTVNNRIYSEEIFAKAMDRAIKRGLYVTMGHFDPVDITTIIGVVTGFKVDENKEYIIYVKLIEGKWSKGLPLNILNFTTSSIGKINKDGVVEELEIISIYPILSNKDISENNES